MHPNDPRTAMPTLGVAIDLVVRDHLLELRREAEQRRLAIAAGASATGRTGRTRTHASPRGLPARRGGS
jgi:hypothetical protein